MFDDALAHVFPVHKLRAVSPYILVMFISLLANWMVQLGYYEYTIRTNPLAFTGERTLLDYKTGIIGDVIVIPLMNAAILYVLLQLKPTFNRVHYVGLAACGLAADALLHFMQGTLKLANWSMPVPFNWDFVGYWHMFSFFFQISFVFLFFYLAYQSWLRRDVKALRATCIVIVLILTFLVLFMYDYLPVHNFSTWLASESHRVAKNL